MKTTHVTRSGFSLVETILFVGILAIISGAIVGVFISTQEARIRQQYVSSLEQRGTGVVASMTKNIRQAESIIVTATGQTGTTLVLQMKSVALFPTIFSRTASGNLLFVQKTSSFPLLGSGVTLKNLTFKNVSGVNVAYSFDLIVIIPLVQPTTYSRHFDGTATLFPVNQLQAGGCGSCALPQCMSHQYQWNYCLSGVCTQSPTTFPC